MATTLELMEEAERRGILPQDKLDLLNEARKRGLVASKGVLDSPDSSLLSSAGETASEPISSNTTSSNNEGIGKDLKDMGLAIATAARNYPGLKQASAGVGTALREIPKMVKGEPTDWGAQYDERLKKQGGIFKDIEKNAPTTSAISDFAAQIPLYEIGGEVLNPAVSKVIGAEAGPLMKLLGMGAKGATVNTAISQAENPNKERLGQDAASGVLGEYAGSALGKIGSYLPTAARNWGSRLYDSMLNRGGTTLQEELARQEGNTLGHEAYDRGLLGTLEHMFGIADKGLEEHGGKLNNILTEGSKPIPVENPRFDAYVSHEQPATLDDMLEGIFGSSKGETTQSGFPERVIVRRPGSVSTAIRPDEVVNRTASAPMGRDIPSPIESKNVADFELQGGKEVPGSKVRVMTDENLPEGPQAQNVSDEGYLNQLKRLRDSKIGIKSAEGEVEQLNRAIQDLENNPSQMTPLEAQALKRRIGGRLTDNKSANPFANPEQSMKTEMDKAQYRGLKDAIEERFMGPNGENPVQDINKELSHYERLKDALKGVQADIQGTSPVGSGGTLWKDTKKILTGGPIQASAEAQLLKKGAAVLSPLTQMFGLSARPYLPKEIDSFLNFKPPADEEQNKVPESAPAAPQNLTDLLSYKDQNAAQNAGKLSPEIQTAIEKVIEQTGTSPQVTSTFRDRLHNAMVGGVPNSAHTTGNGIDFSLDGLTPAQIKSFVSSANGLPNVRAMVHQVYGKPHIHMEYRG